MRICALSQLSAVVLISFFVSVPTLADAPTPDAIARAIDDAAHGRVDSHLSNLDRHATTYGLAFGFRDQLFEHCGYTMSGAGIAGGEAMLTGHREELLDLALMYRWRETLVNRRPPEVRPTFNAGAARVFLDTILATLPIRIARDLLDQQAGDLVPAAVMRLGGCSDDRVRRLAINLTRLALWQNPVAGTQTSLVEARTMDNGSVLMCLYDDDPSDASALRQYFNAYRPGSLGLHFGAMMEGIDDRQTRAGCPGQPDPTIRTDVAYRAPVYDEGRIVGDSAAERLASLFLDNYLPARRSEHRWPDDAETLATVRSLIVAIESIPVDEAEVRAATQAYADRVRTPTEVRMEMPYRLDPHHPVNLCVAAGGFRWRKYFGDTGFDEAQVGHRMIRSYFYARCEDAFRALREGL